jgi:hypothetical protein
MKTVQIMLPETVILEHSCGSWNLADILFFLDTDFRRYGYRAF